MTLNMLWDGKLYEVQARVLEQMEKGEPVSLGDAKILRGNIVAHIADFFAPSNLIVGTFCLTDLLTGRNFLERVIERLCMRCCGVYGSPAPLWWKEKFWLEGYGYWCYAKRFLRLYWNRFNVGWMKDFIAGIEDNFLTTSYRRNDYRYYPAPFGDIYDLPLESNESVYMLKGVGSVHREGIEPVIYNIELDPAGFNLHTSRVRKVYTVTKGNVAGFAYYTGYKNKYPTVWSQIRAMFQWSRFVSLFKILFI